MFGVSWAVTLCVHFWGLLPPNGILPGVKFSLRPSISFSYIGNITALHSRSGRQTNFAAWYSEWNYETFAEGATYIQLGGHHVGHRPTFWLFFFALHGQHIAPIKVKFDMEEPNFALFGAEMFVWDPVSCDIFGIFRL